jgi:hypothetical protein
MVQDTMKLGTKSEFIDFAHYHYKQKYLEGTGVHIFDTINQKNYVNISPRADAGLLATFMENFNSHMKSPYSTVTFKATNDGHPIYHTNVMLGMLTDHAVVSLESVRSKKEREALADALTSKETNSRPKKLIDISMKEVNEFCGNVLQVLNDKDEECVIMSTRAFNGFTKENRKTLEERYRIVHADLSTIEHIGGGSARCLIAEVYE